MKILSVGDFSGLSNTCLHRNWALKEIADEVDEVDTSTSHISMKYRIAYHLFLYGLPIHLPDEVNANDSIKFFVKTNKYDIVWIDKGVIINPETLLFIKKFSPDTKIVSYSPDNMALRHNQSQNYIECIPLYDVHFTTKSYIIEEMKRLGAMRIYFTNKLYEPRFHYPRNLTDDEIKRLGGDVGFIGMWEKERCESILYLAEHGIHVKVYGSGKWNRYKNVPNLTINPGVFSEDYPKALQAFKISLCFLRKMNFDQQTSRTMEIPACGGFMLAERTTEHLALFKEGKEAEFFSTNEELLKKCRYYLLHDDERRRIAKAGNLRCRESGYSNKESLCRMIDIVQSCVNG